MLLAGCGDTVSKADLEALKAQLAAKEQELATVQQQVTELRKSPVVPTRDDDALPIYSAQRMPPVDAAPSPRQPVPVPQDLPASYAETLGPYTMYIEHIAGVGASKYGLSATLGCVQDSVFKRGMKMAFRLELYATATNMRLTPDGHTTVKIALPSGDELPLNFNRRGGLQGAPDAPWQWVTAWHIPPDYPLGAVDYTVLVTDREGKTTSLKPPVQRGVTSLRIID
jgi:hypothetical protein